ncbi:MAG: prepilin-type N-terminal cleavage/methylation domain-containing protein [Firmicutes bacterium]|nr:prepilin-type N-terminal cleavage/methylation domain-containing protein [Bacillota bacterium]
MLNFFYRSLNNEKGFTLIEVLVVVAIIAILAAIATPIILGRINQAREASDEALASTLENALALYLVDKDADPSIDTVTLNATGFPDELKILWTDHGNDYLDNKTIEFLGNNTDESGNTVTGRVLTITYDPTTGIIQTSGGSIDEGGEG